MSAEPVGGLRAYRELFAPAERRTLFVAGLVARIPLALVGFSILIFIEGETGSFATAGLASGLATAAMAAVSPIFGRIADRRGQRGAIVAAAIAHPVAIALLIVVGSFGAVLPLVALCAVFVGATIAPVGAFMRSRWSIRLGDGPLLQVAFSAEAIADELVWVFGPALAALVASSITPSAGLIMSAVVGTGGMVWLLRGAPIGPVLAHESGPRVFFRPWRSRWLLAVLFANVAVGVVFGINDVTVVSWTTEIGVPQIAGLVLTAYSIGSVIGGFLMGFVPTRWPAYRVFVGTTLLFSLLWIALSFSPTPYWLFPIGLFAGMTIAPFAIAGNRVVHESVSPAVFTEALAWVSACVVGAMALGSFLGGVIDDAYGANSGFAVVGALAGLPFVITLLLGLGRRRAAVPAE